MFDVIATAVQKELVHNIGNGNGNGTKGFDPYILRVGDSKGWEVLVGADHGQGAWRSWIRMYPASPDLRRQRHEAWKLDKTNEPNIGITRQVAHIKCKKDNAKVLRETGVSGIMCEGYDQLQTSH